MPSLTSNEHISHLPPVSVLSSPNHRACHPAADKVALLTSAGGRGDGEKGVEMVTRWRTDARFFYMSLVLRFASWLQETEMGCGTFCLLKFLTHCSHSRHCSSDRWPISLSAFCLLPTRDGCQGLQKCSLMTAQRQGWFIFRCALTPPPLQNWRADNGGIARCASWSVCTMLQFKLANLINSWQVEKNATEMTFSSHF